MTDTANDDVYRAPVLPTDVHPERPHPKTAEELRAHLDRGRRLGHIIRETGHVIRPDTLDAIEAALQRDDRLRALERQR